MAGHRTRDVAGALDRDGAIAEESAGDDHTLAWWFVQGTFAGPRVGRRCFMTAVFRQSVPSDIAPERSAYARLVSVLDPTSGRHAFVSEIAPEAVEAFARLSRGVRPVNLDSRMVDLLVDEIVTHGPPQPVRVQTAPVRLTSMPLDLRWADFRLRQSERGFELELCCPETQRRCRFRLRVISRRMRFDALGVPGCEPMAYLSYPRLELTGTVGDEPVRGQAWLDHQWGGYGWLVTQSLKGRVLGWDWFGINLDDGTDILLLIHRDAETREALAGHGVLFQGDEPPRLCRHFMAAPTRHWWSPTTRTSYPVAWRIQIPSIGADLDVQPLADEQEIPFFGMIRCIWEGAARVSGTKAGRNVSGRARLELHGYGYVFDFKDYLVQIVDRIDQKIQEVLPRRFDERGIERLAGSPQWQRDPGAYTSVLSAPLWDLISRRGRHWRPVFGLLLLEALGVRSEPYEAFVSVAAELPHTASLIIDDIEDNSSRRRGDVSIHLRYGLDVAINSANLSYFLPYLLLGRLRDVSEEQRLTLFAILTRGFLRSHVGQAQDIYWSKHITAEDLTRCMNDNLRPKVLQAYADKTAAMVEGLAEAACVLAESDARTRRLCSRFARTFGVAFQIIDDVHDFSDTRRRKHAKGKDLREGKLTYVILRAMERLSPSDRERLQAILCSRAMRGTVPCLSEGIELVHRSGALASCAADAREMVAEQWTRLSERVPPSEAKTMLRMLCFALLDV